MDLNKILLIVAHPDDDILGCGGFLSKYSSKNEIRVVFLAEGSSCRFSDIKKNKQLIDEAVRERTVSAIKALEFLGISDCNFYDLPCGRLDTLPIIEINKIIEEEITTFNPNTIMTHSESDLNNDHKIVYKSVMMAARPGCFDSLNKIISFEVLSSTEWNFDQAFSPNLFEELSEKDLERKWKAFSCYESEVRSLPHPRSYEGIKTLASYRGLQSGKCYAEGYRLIREIHE